MKKQFKTDKVINLKGKDYILFEGLLEIAHNEFNILSIETDLVQAPSSENGNMAIFKAVCKCKDEEGNEKVFTGYGDADDTNVNKMIKVHKIRMAETRAIARALRMLTGAGTVFEELGDIDNEPKVSKNTYKKEIKHNNTPASDKQKNFMFKLIREYAETKNKTPEDVQNALKDKMGIEDLDSVESSKAHAIITMLQDKK